MSRALWFLCLPFRTVWYTFVVLGCLVAAPHMLQPASHTVLRAFGLIGWLLLAYFAAHLFLLGFFALVRIYQYMRNILSAWYRKLCVYSNHP